MMTKLMNEQKKSKRKDDKLVGEISTEFINTTILHQIKLRYNNFGHLMGKI